MKNMAIKTLYKLIMNDFAPNIRAEILVSFIMFDHEIDLKGLCLALSTWRVK